MTDLAYIGAEVLRARRKNGLSQAALAERAGVSRQTLGPLERGVSTEISFVALSRIMNAAGLRLAVQETITDAVQTGSLVASEDVAVRVARGSA